MGVGQDHVFKAWRCRSEAGRTVNRGTSAGTKCTQKTVSFTVVSTRAAAPRTHLDFLKKGEERDTHTHTEDTVSARLSSTYHTSSTQKHIHTNSQGTSPSPPSLGPSPRKRMQALLQRRVARCQAPASRPAACPPPVAHAPVSARRCRRAGGWFRQRLGSAFARGCRDGTCVRQGSKRSTPPPFPLPHHVGCPLCLPARLCRGCTRLSLFGRVATLT